MLTKRKSLKSELLTTTFLALIVPYLLVAVVGSTLVNWRITRLNESQLTNAMIIAGEVFREKVDRVKTDVNLLAHSARFYKDAETVAARIRPLLHSIKQEKVKLDALTFIPGADGGMAALSFEDPVILKSITHGKPVAGLRKVNNLELSETFSFIGRPIPGRGERLIMEAAAPVFDTEGNILGTLSGIRVLNGSSEIPEHISYLIFHDILLKKGQLGSVEIHSGGLRISSNLQETSGYSEQSEAAELLKRAEQSKGRIVDTVVKNGQVSLASAQSLRDIRGSVVGTLSIWIPENALMAHPKLPLLIFSALILITFLVAYILSRYHARLIVGPINSMVASARLISQGDYSREIPPQSTREFRILVESFNRVTRKYKKLVDNLEEKVTERSHQIETMQRQLMQADRLASVGQLAAGVAHEINNPLTAILTNASLMADALPEDDPNKKDMEVVVNESLRCRKIVRGLLNFSRQSTPDFTSINPNEIVETSIRLLRHQIKERRVTLSRSFTNELPNVNADTDQLQQVLLNLFLNALDAMEEGGNLHVSTGKEDEWIHISISDTGGGIEKEVIDRVFDPFFTTKFHGTGLGLSISYGIIQQHDGKILVESEVGKGSTFIILLPVPEKAAPLSP